ncbi:MAG TPA: dihydroorotate dehydrogenase-like protein [Acidimicrobiales bacterium]|nr:dihydroorotate dehydrogenase-like protein [Acidimicrobiales bacterium]
MSSASVDLRTTYLGLALHSPIVASASPLTGNVATARRLSDAGVGAIVLPSLFEEEIVAEELRISTALDAGAFQQPEASSYFPAMPVVPTVAEHYVQNLARVKAAVDVPVIASLNATSPGSWSRYAALLAAAGADALELNIYRVVTDPALDAAAVELAELELVRDVCRRARLPVAVKLSPYYSALANFAGSIVGAGAAGMVLFNRFYQPDLDLEELEVVPRLELSSQFELRLPLRWLAILRPQLPSSVSLAASSGVHGAEDVAKALAVGADVVMTTSELLHSGPEEVRSLEEDLRRWLYEHEYTSVSELRGSVSRVAAEDGEAFERANYMQTLRSWAVTG